MQHEQLNRIERKMDLAIALLLHINNQQQTEFNSMTTTVQDILDEVHAESTIDSGLATLIAGLQANQADPAALQAILDGMKANIAPLSAALQSTGTGPAPVATPAPTPAPAPAPAPAAGP